ncbi:acetolactate decarboxylase [Sporomusaceae bacterium BoRhaA]|uniref:acetolactate decarboxylase n=1 Tax=Pelorhabdus rhamnosifermentans TaxID=2772457 RepID=UPI001C0630DF|nr:acetolactate decarboxylase [Pelorhabdus rhamnosifermentans]MBU2703236.1 acetolactate decarboxylase [Pelorhabdus rhamnosifermentans]
MKLFNRIAIFVIGLLFFTAIASAQAQNSLYQVSTINALLQGVYDGEVTIKELKQHGSFGIGTLERLDGEMIALGGNFYQVKSTGEVVLVNDQVKTPFATVMDFVPERTGEIHDIQNFNELEKALDSIIQDRNYIYAIRIDGVFSGKTRSIPGKSKPYPSLTEAAKTQSVFDIQNTPGTIVGFWCPQYVNGINVTGYHLHFISDDRKSGGHILSGGVQAGKVQIARITNFEMVLPSSDAFQQAALNKDYSKELNGVEKSK